MSKVFFAFFPIINLRRPFVLRPLHFVIFAGHQSLALHFAIPNCVSCYRQFSRPSWLWPLDYYWSICHWQEIVCLRAINAVGSRSVNAIVSRTVSGIYAVGIYAINIRAINAGWINPICGVAGIPAIKAVRPAQINLISIRIKLAIRQVKAIGAAQIAEIVAPPIKPVRAVGLEIIRSCRRKRS